MMRTPESLGISSAPSKFTAPAPLGMKSTYCAPQSNHFLYLLF
jgi:hypothetical protein